MAKSTRRNSSLRTIGAQFQVLKVVDPTRRPNPGGGGVVDRDVVEFGADKGVWGVDAVRSVLGAADAWAQRERVNTWWGIGLSTVRTCGEDGRGGKSAAEGLAGWGG
eukprot:COSAG04_NODE_8126_length_1020_cov_1.244300_1_plen_106_part_10